jgi:hypothetical protein
MSDTITQQEHEERLRRATAAAYDKGRMDGIAYAHDRRAVQPLTAEIVGAAHKLWLRGERPSGDWQGDDCLMIHPILGAVLAREDELVINGNLWRVSRRHVTQNEYPESLHPGMGALALEIAAVRALLPDLVKASDALMRLSNSSPADYVCNHTGWRREFFELAQSLRLHPAVFSETMKAMVKT